LLQQNPAMVTPQLVATIKLLMQQTDQEDKQYTLLQQILAQAELQVGLSEQATPNIARP